MTANRYKVSSVADKNISKLIMVMDTQTCKYAENH